jgi:arsenate reductase
MLAEFVGVTLFLTAIISAASYFSKGDANPFHAAALAITLGIAALLTGSISGGHLNPAVSLYFFSRKELSAVDFIGYVAAQLLGATAGVALGEYLHGYTIGGFTTAASTLSAGPAFVGEVVATAGLVLLIITLIQNKMTHLIPFGLMLWVFAAFNFTPTGAQANPAVTFGLMVDGTLNVSSGAQLVLAEIVGLLVAVILNMLLTSATAKKKAAAKKK